MPPTLRYAGLHDLHPITDIRNHYVRDGHSSFDEVASEPDDNRSWLASFRPTGPHRMIVAEIDGAVAGYASSNPYRAPHPAFRETIEVSIQLAPAARGQGIGTALYTRLFADLRGERLHRAVAGIALPNPASIALHRRFGFREVGTFDEYAIKHGRYLSSTWMQRSLEGLG